jgi:hypothetical protein
MLLLICQREQHIERRAHMAARSLSAYLLHRDLFTLL